jgi:hypothetical protein
MKLGTEEKWKVYALGGLLAVAAYFVYDNFSSSPSTPAPKSVVSERNNAVEVPPPDNGAAARSALPTAPRQAPTRARSDEFRPALRSRRPEDRVDPLTIDPTLRLDLLAKVQEVKSEGGARNLFQFGAAPPKELPKGPEPIIAVAAKKFDFPRPDPPPPPKVEPVVPPEPPIDVKYYGLATKQIDGKKTAFFLDGENIILAPEGGLVKKKYRVIRIGVSSVLMENVDNKKQQSLPLAEDAGANMGN